MARTVAEALFGDLAAPARRVQSNCASSLRRALNFGNSAASLRTLRVCALPVGTACLHSSSTKVRAEARYLSGLPGAFAVRPTTFSTFFGLVMVEADLLTAGASRRTCLVDFRRLVHLAVRGTNRCFFCTYAGRRLAGGRLVVTGGSLAIFLLLRSRSANQRTRPDCSSDAAAGGTTRPGGFILFCQPTRPPAPCALYLPWTGLPR